jgi:N-glycosylase/DNA lyase
MWSEITFPATDYNLAATLNSGQVFRWEAAGEGWQGVVGKHFVRLIQAPGGIRAEAAGRVENWDWLRHFLQIEVDYPAVLRSFPDDEPMREAVAACRGLRLLRQDPWECLASFILSSTKQIVQIRQIVARLCDEFGEPLAWPRSAGARPGATPEPHEPCRRPALEWHAFPTPEQIAATTEAELRRCKMGFRACGLLAAARQIAGGGLELEKVRALDYAAARAELMRLHGVGGKIADCVLLFAYGCDGAFPVDTWVERALQEWYFPRRRAGKQQLREFADRHFGPHAGYAQQYLFHHRRTRDRARQPGMN